MRTTLDLNPDVYRAAKLKAAQDDRDALYSAMEGR